MLNHPTLDKLNTLKLSGMSKALAEQAQNSEIDSLSFEERLGLLVDREITERENRRFRYRLSHAKLKHQATIEDIDYTHQRGLDRTLTQQLITGQWIRQGYNLIITGPTGIGKSWLASALAYQGCRYHYNVLYLRVPRLLSDLALAKGDGRYINLLSNLAKRHLIVLDDWGLNPIHADQARDLLEIFDDRYHKHATLITSQLPIEKWHELISEPTLADAILDRIVHQAYKLNLKGESLRKTKTKLPLTDETELA